MYMNEDRKCDCYQCEIGERCNYFEKYQRLPADIAPGALGLCPKLKNANEYSFEISRYTTLEPPFKNIRERQRLKNAAEKMQFGTTHTTKTEYGNVKIDISLEVPQGTVLKLSQFSKSAVYALNELSSIFSLYASEDNPDLIRKDGTKWIITS